MFWWSVRASYFPIQVEPPPVETSCYFHILLHNSIISLWFWTQTAGKNIENVSVFRNSESTIFQTSCYKFFLILISPGWNFDPTGHVNFQKRENPIRFKNWRIEFAVDCTHWSALSSVINILVCTGSMLRRAPVNIMGTCTLSTNLLSATRGDL